MLKKLKLLLRNLLLSHVTPKEVAFSFAVGVFISFTPLLGFHTLLAAGLMVLLRKNKVAAIIGVWINNPITLFPMFYAAYETGLFIMGEKKRELSPDSLMNIFNLGKEILIPLSLGGIVLGMVSAICSYFVVCKIYPIILHKKEEWLHRLRDRHEHP
ncbi:DUF2062 domain-containing protein [bacterium]|nr:DUF2062 domain-containing protein [bacterium]